MKRATDIVIVVIKAIRIAGAILFLGRFFGLHVREAGGHVVGRTGAGASHACATIDVSGDASTSPLRAHRAHSSVG